MPVLSSTELRQFICYECPGLNPRVHSYHRWHKRVDCSNPVSKCRTCKRWIKAVPRGEEEGVKICHFACSCSNEFVVHCEMRDTAPCYACHGDEDVSPYSFERLRKIHKETDNTHNCSKCHGQGSCPNMESHHESEAQCGAESKLKSQREQREQGEAGVRAKQNLSDQQYCILQRRSVQKGNGTSVLGGLGPLI